MVEVEVPARFLSVVQKTDPSELDRVQDQMRAKMSGGETTSQAAGEAVAAGLNEEFGKWFAETIKSNKEPVRLVTFRTKQKASKTVPLIVLAICVVLILGRILGVTSGGPASGVASVIHVPEGLAAEFATVTESNEPGSVRAGALANLLASGFVLFGGTWAILKLRRR